MTARLTIDLEALARNYRTLRDTAGVRAAPAVKADGYGLGAVEVSRRLMAEGADLFYVARLGEGAALRRALGEAVEIRVLDGATPGDTDALIEADLTPVINSLAQAERWRAEGDGRPIALHVDTGMNRLGVSADEAERLGDWSAVATVMSHLACAGQPDHPLNARQLERFRAVRGGFPTVQAGLASSAGIFLGPDYAFDEVRPGISLFGGGPFDRPDARIAPVATLEAPILQVRDLPRGETIGYGATFTAEAPMRVAVLAVGYADGVLRSAWPGGVVWLEGERRRILGRVSMDLIAVDVTGIAVGEGQPVQIIGPDLPVDEAAAAAGTTAYEFLTRLSTRAERVYLG